MTVEDLRETVVARCIAGLESVGVPDAAAWLKVEIDEQRRVVLMKHPDDDFSGVLYRNAADGFVVVSDSHNELTTADEGWVDRHWARLARGWMRQAATEGRKPLWSYSTHRLIAGIMRSHGLHASLLQYAKDDNINASAMKWLAMEARIEMGEVEENGGCITIREMQPADLAFKLSSFGRPYVIIPDARLPETMMADLVGRKLSDVIGHPSIARAGPIPIEHAEMEGGYLTLILKDVQEPLARPPVGTDRRWLRMPMHPWVIQKRP